MFLAAEVSEAADVGDDEGGGEAVFCADLAEVDAAVFEGEAAAVAVVADLDELALEGFVGEVVADAGSEVEAFAGEVAVADQGADLVREGLFEGDEARRRSEWEIGLDGIVVEPEVGDGGEEFAVGLHFQKRAQGDEALDLGIVLKDLLDVIVAAGRDFEIADDGRPVARAEREGEGRDGVERFEDVALAVNDRATERGIEIMFLVNAPREEFLWLVITGFAEEALGDAVLDFVGVGERGVGIEADEVGEIVDAGDVAVGDDGLDGVLVAFARFAFVERGAIKKTLERGRAEFDGEFAGVASDRLRAHLAGGVVGVAVISGAEGGGGGDAEPVAEVKRDCDFGSEFGARYEGRRV